MLGGGNGGKANRHILTWNRTPARNQLNRFWLRFLVVGQFAFMSRMRLSDAYAPEPERRLLSAWVLAETAKK